MRDILFKAKRIDNGEWVEGALFDGKQYCVIGQQIKFSPDIENECKIVGYRVDRDTICQYTGLTDKNGNKIWENDVIRHYNINWKPEKYTIGFVRWNGVECRLENVVKDIAYTMNHGCKYEVISNIFDNAELLGATETIGHADNGGLMSAT